MGTQNELVQRLEDGYNKFSKGQKKLADFISFKGRLARWSVQNLIPFNEWK